MKKAFSVQESNEELCVGIISQKNRERRQKKEPR